MPSGEYLLIDNSNSFTKFALATRDKLGPIRKVATTRMDAASLTKVLRGWKFEKVILSSVVPKVGDYLAKSLQMHKQHRVGARTALGVGIDYPSPDRIGADRLANAAAAVPFYGAPCVVVDFGTAVTFDIIDQSESYVGGVIAPGLEAMTDYLHQRTALLPRVKLLEPPSAIGKSTKHAMLAGAVFGYRGLIRQILAEIKAELGSRRLKVVATGGYAELIAVGVKEIQEVHPNLTLEGLRLIGNFNP